MYNQLQCAPTVRGRCTCLLFQTCYTMCSEERFLTLPASCASGSGETVLCAQWQNHVVVLILSFASWRGYKKYIWHIIISVTNVTIPQCFRVKCRPRLRWTGCGWRSCGSGWRARGWARRGPSPCWWPGCWPVWATPWRTPRTLLAAGAAWALILHMLTVICNTSTGEPGGWAQTRDRQRQLPQKGAGRPEKFPRSPSGPTRRAGWRMDTNSLVLIRDWHNHKRI